MKSTLKLLTLVLTLLILSCGGGEEQKKETSSKVKLKKQTTEKKVEAKKSETKPSKSIDLTNKGIGPIKSLALAPEVDQTMASHGKDVFKKMCTACHKATKKFIGPAPKNILLRRTPEWIMNMILNPDEMTQKDPLAKSLLIEFNGSPMANQNLSEEDARAVLEYFRTLK